MIKVKKIYLNDDKILIPGHLFERPFRKPVFYPFDNRCGFSYQIIHDKNDLVEYSESAYRAFYAKHKDSLDE